MPRTIRTTCSACDEPVFINLDAGRVTALAGSVEFWTTIAPEGGGLLYWDCPACDEADSLDPVEAGAR